MEQLRTMPVGDDGTAPGRTELWSARRKKPKVLLALPGGKIACSRSEPLPDAALRRQLLQRLSQFCLSLDAEWSASLAGQESGYLSKRELNAEASLAVAGVYERLCRILDGCRMRKGSQIHGMEAASEGHHTFREEVLHHLAPEVRSLLEYADQNEAEIQITAQWKRYRWQSSAGGGAESIPGVGRCSDGQAGCWVMGGKFRVVHKETVRASTFLDHVAAVIANHWNDSSGLLSQIPEPSACLEMLRVEAARYLHSAARALRERVIRNAYNSVDQVFDGLVCQSLNTAELVGRLVWGCPEARLRKIVEKRLSSAG